MDEHVPHINVEAPIEEMIGPKVLDDATSTINPFFYNYDDPNVRGLFETLYPASHTIELITGLEGDFEYGNNVLHRPELGFGTGAHSTQGSNNFPYPYDFVTQDTYRSPADVESSPFTADGSCDAFNGLNSPSFPPNSPYLSSGDFSHTNSSPSLSPLARGLGEVALDSDEVQIEGPSIFRTRSYSVTEQTVAPSDTWRDPSGRPRSASYSAPSITKPANEKPFETSLELDEIVLDEGFASQNGSHYGELGLAFFNGGFLTSHNTSPALPSMSTGEPDTSTLFAPAEEPSRATDIIHPAPRHPSPKQPVVLSLDTDLSFHNSASGRHYRSSSDSSCLSADSPADRRNNGLTHRSSPSSPQSRRHSPYPSILSSPASATSENQLSPYLSSQEFANLGIADVVPPPSIPRRSTLSVTRSPLKIDNALLHRAPSDPSSTRYGIQKRRNGKSRSPPSQSAFIASSSSPISATSSTGSHLTSPSGSVLSEVDLPSSEGYKHVVASQRIVEASNSRRTREARFKCEYEDCPSTFTAKHNLRNHMLSHNGVKPYECPNCGERFTTQGVRSRHEGKCTPEADHRRRKQIRR